MNVLVTGGAGFIGSHLIEALISDSEIKIIRVIDNFITGNRRNLNQYFNRIEFHNLNLLELENHWQVLDDVHVIFHLAAIPSTQRSITAPVENHLYGVHATAVLLDAARKAGVKRLIFAASASAYGNTESVPISENQTFSPLTPYAATKLSCECYLKAYAECYDMDAVSLRYFNVFGPRQEPSSPYSGVIAKFCCAFHSRHAPNVVGDGKQTRDFVFVRDVVNANLLAAHYSKRFNGLAINVGSGVGTQINDLVCILNELTGFNLSSVHVPERSGESRNSVADISLARKLLGFNPSYALRDGLAETYRWYQDENG